jgi:hypothetical protein
MKDMLLRKGVLSWLESSGVGASVAKSLFDHGDITDMMDMHKVIQNAKAAIDQLDSLVSTADSGETKW